jgi:hypothetical protein
METSAAEFAPATLASVQSARRIVVLLAAIAGPPVFADPTFV